MEESFAVVPNHQPAFIAEPVKNGEEEVVDVDLDRVVAWRIDVRKNEQGKTSSMAVPVTVNIPVDDTNFVLYYSDTTQWEQYQGEVGKGLDSLLAHFKEYS